MFGLKCKSCLKNPQAKTCKNAEKNNESRKKKTKKRENKKDIHASRQKRKQQKSLKKKTTTTTKDWRVTMAKNKDWFQKREDYKELVNRVGDSYKLTWLCFIFPPFVFSQVCVGVI